MIKHTKIQELAKFLLKQDLTGCRESVRQNLNDLALGRKQTGHITLYFNSNNTYLASLIFYYVDNYGIQVEIGVTGSLQKSKEFECKLKDLIRIHQLGLEVSNLFGG